MVTEAVREFCRKHDLNINLLSEKGLAMIYIYTDSNNLVQLTGENYPYSSNLKDKTYVFGERNTKEIMGSLVVKRDIEPFKLKSALVQKHAQLVVEHRRKLRRWISRHTQYQTRKVVNAI